MLGSESTDAVPAASSPCSSSHSLQGPPAEPPTSSAPTPFAAAALMRASFTDLSEAESEFSSTPRSSIDGQEPRHASAHAASTRTARAVPKSPKSPSRAHVQQPLDESEGMKPVLAKLGMLERTHSAPGGVPFGMLLDFAGGATRPRIRLPVSIPEDRPVAPAAPAPAADSVTRPFRKIYPHGSDEEADSPKADLPETPRERHQILPASLSQELNPRPHASAALHEGRVHSGAYPTSSQLLSEASLPRVEFPKLHAAVTSAPDWGEEHMEGQVRGGFPRVSSHPENLAGLAAVATMMESPFSRHPLQSVSAQRRSGSYSPSSAHQPFLANLVNGTSSSTASSINPWASPTQHSNLLKSRRTSTLGNRSRNGSAALSELTRLRSMCASDETVPDDVPVSSSM
ncbi:hypothetical protein ABBQ38_000078 [Trebouxia sp. C0009 RCD-2024]